MFCFIISISGYLFPLPFPAFVWWLIGLILIVMNRLRDSEGHLLVKEFTPVGEEVEDPMKMEVSLVSCHRR